jgi:hypothetical protein
MTDVKLEFDLSNQQIQDLFEFLIKAAGIAAGVVEGADFTFSGNLLTIGPHTTVGPEQEALDGWATHPLQDRGTSSILNQENNENIVLDMSSHAGKTVYITAQPGVRRVRNRPQKAVIDILDNLGSRPVEGSLNLSIVLGTVTIDGAGQITGVDAGAESDVQESRNVVANLDPEDFPPGIPGGGGGGMTKEAQEAVFKTLLTLAMRNSNPDNYADLVEVADGDDVKQAAVWQMRSEDIASSSDITLSGSSVATHKAAILAVAPRVGGCIEEVTTFPLSPITNLVFIPANNWLFDYNPIANPFGEAAAWPFDFDGTTIHGMTWLDLNVFPHRYHMRIETEQVTVRVASVTTSDWVPGPGQTAIQDLGATFQSWGVQRGDIIEILGGSPNTPTFNGGNPARFFVVSDVLGENDIVIWGTVDGPGYTSGDVHYKIEERKPSGTLIDPNAHISGEVLPGGATSSDPTWSRIDAPDLGFSDMPSGNAEFQSQQFPSPVTPAPGRYWVVYGADDTYTYYSEFSAWALELNGWPDLTPPPNFGIVHGEDILTNAGDLADFGWFIMQGNFFPPESPAPGKYITYSQLTGGFDGIQYPLINFNGPAPSTGDLTTTTKPLGAHTVALKATFTAGSGESVNTVALRRFKTESDAERFELVVLNNDGDAVPSFEISVDGGPLQAITPFTPFTP